MTILDPSECSNCDPPFNSTFATKMSMRRSSRVTRKPKYYLDEVASDQLNDEVISSSDQSDTEWNESGSDDEKQRKRIKLSRCSPSLTPETPTSSNSHGLATSRMSKQRSTTGATMSSNLTTGSTSRKSSRSSPVSGSTAIANLPEEDGHVDENYRLRRERNNQSVRKSRARVREATKAAVKCIDELTKEKNQLAKDQEILDKEISLLKKLIYHTFSPQANTSAVNSNGGQSSTQDEHSYSSRPADENENQVIDLSGLKFFDEMLSSI